MFCDPVIKGAAAGEPRLMNRSFERHSLLKELTRRGVRLTPQRLMLLEIIQEAGEHLDATALLAAAQARDGSVNRATVYRTLRLLKRMRLIDELDLMHLHGERHYYEVRTRREHIHLACFECGRIVEFASPLFEKLKLEIARRSGFEIRLSRMEAGGLCGECKVKAKAKERSA